MNSLFFVLIAQTDPALADALKKIADAAQKSADAAERAAKAAEAAAAATQTAPVQDNKVQTPTPMFTGTAGLSLVYLAGNSNAITASALVNMQLTLKEWTIAGNLNGAFGQARGPADVSDRVTALQFFGELKGGRQFNELLGAYVLGGGGLDHVAKIAWRAYGEAGATVTFVKKKEGDFLKVLLTTDIGLRYLQEGWYVFFADANFATPGVPDPSGKRALPFRLGINFRYGIREGLVFTELLELLPDVLSVANFNLINTTSLSVKIVGPLALQTSFLLRYNGTPAPGARPLDTQLALSATVTF